MQKKPKENMDISFRNPFDDYNANVLTPELIMQYWFSPFNTVNGLDELSFYTDKMPIILQGSRGSGKTTILKYFSFSVQLEKSIRNNLSLRKQIKSDGGVGFYLRCDDSFLSMFKTVFSLREEKSWLNCFKHYLELFFSKNIIKLIKSIDLNPDETNRILETFRSICEAEDILNLDSISKIELYIDEEIKYINRYKNIALFNNEDFHPKYIWDFYSLSHALITSVTSNLEDFKDTIFLLLIDEFENLPLDLQKMFNSLIKFCKPGISFRVGRRSENESVVTKETVNTTEYLREDNDYRLISLDYQGTDIKNLKPYLAGIAQKRLEAFEGITIPQNVQTILGDNENLDLECAQVVNSKDDHLHEILKQNPELSGNSQLRMQIINTIKCSDNVLAVTLCALWVARSNAKDLLHEAASAAKTMLAYFSKDDNPSLVKFQNDYSNKYRYALAVLICSLYKRDKMYYSFNTLCYLSDGNTRIFINLIKEIISHALFYEKTNFLSNGIISPETQDRAIKEYSSSEFHSVCSIVHEGKFVRNLILNIGNVLSEYHKDKYVRYPETTQFIYNYDDLSDRAKKIINTAESWALIKRRSDKQRITAGIKHESFLYTINRIFVPLFNISYRIRGGVNVIFSNDDIDAMIEGHQISKLSEERKKSSSKKITKKDTVTGIQMDFLNEVDSI